MTDSQVAYEQLKQKLRLRLAALLENGAREGEATDLDREAISTQLRLLLSASREPRQPVLSAQEQARLVEELADEIIGAGPLEPLLADPEVTEIMVNGPGQVYVERGGRLERTGVAFRDANHLMSVIERLLDTAGASVTESEPCLDATLPDGARINVIIPPLVLNGPTMTIRKKLRRWTMDDFIAYGTLTPQVAELLAACVKAKVNLVISGGTSTGKTTLVSILSSFILQEERIITIENVAELDLPNREHWIRLVARAPNIEGRGEMPLRALVRNAMRMRPDRIILGEARGGEALDVVQAMHTGHQGVITVMHADSPQAALERLETLMLMSGLDLPPQACRMQIASAIELIVHLSRFPDGSRKVTQVSQVAGVEAQGFVVEDLFRFEPKGLTSEGQVLGSLVATGTPPRFMKKFDTAGLRLPPELFHH